MSIITANELKTKGIASLEEGLKDDLEAVITLRGKERFVVMTMEQYQYLREMELEAAWAQAREDIDNGRFHTDIDRHIKAVTNAIES